jgi:hypothetical protein
MQILKCGFGKEVKVKKTSITEMCICVERGERESAMTFTEWWGGAKCLAR